MHAAVLARRTSPSLSDTRPSASALVQPVPSTVLTLVIAAELSPLKAVSSLEACWPSGGKGGRIPERRLSSPRPETGWHPGGAVCGHPTSPWWRAPPAGPLGASSGFNHRCPRLARLCGPGPPQRGGRGSRTHWEASPRSDGAPSPHCHFHLESKLQEPKEDDWKKRHCGLLVGASSFFQDMWNINVRFFGSSPPRSFGVPEPLCSAAPWWRSQDHPVSVAHCQSGHVSWACALRGQVGQPPTCSTYCKKGAFCLHFPLVCGALAFSNEAGVLGLSWDPESLSGPCVLPSLGTGLFPLTVLRPRGPSSSSKKPCPSCLRAFARMVASPRPCSTPHPHTHLT